MQFVALNCAPDALTELQRLAQKYSQPSHPCTVQHLGNIRQLIDLLPRIRVDALIVMTGSPAAGETLAALHRGLIKLPVITWPRGVELAQPEEQRAGKVQIWLPERHQVLTGPSTTDAFPVIMELVAGWQAQQAIAAAPTSTPSAVATAQSSTDRSVRAESIYRCFDQLSHDLRTPLTVIREYTDLFRRKLLGPLSRQQSEYLTIIQDRNEELISIVEDLIDARRCQLGLLTFRRHCSDLRPRLAALVAKMQRRSKSKGVAVELSVPDALPSVFCDIDRVCRAIYGLMLNALKYSEPDSTIRVEVEHNPGSLEVGVRIRDSFVPVSSDELDRALATFQNARCGFDPELSLVFGPGIAIAKETIERSFGRFDLHSQIGVGTTTTCTLPIFDLPLLIKRYAQQIDASSSSPATIHLFEIRAENLPDNDASQVIDDFLQHSQDRYGLMIPVGRLQWLWLVAPDQAGVPGSIELLHRWEMERQNAPFAALPEIKVEMLQSWPAGTSIWVMCPTVEEAYQRLRAGQPPQRRVLLADDDFEALAGLVGRLEAFGYEVISALNGEQCVRAAIDRRPDAILVDSNLQGAGGQRVYLDLMQNGQTMNFPILMLAEDIREQQRALEQGVREIVGKRHDPDRLHSSLEKILSGC